jgi:RNA 2',3'-cyclic 3'-phosphodiesterase
VTAGGRLSAFGDPDLLTGRLFFALAVPNPVKAPLEAAMPALSRLLPRARFSSPASWHLTLAFLGQVRAEFGGDVVTVGEAAAAAAPRRLTLNLDGAGGFPTTDRARLLWIGIGGDREALNTLATALAEGSRESGMHIDDRSFHAHLTLARLGQPRPLPPEVVERVSEAAADAPPWDSTELHCYRSTQTNQGARYTIVRSFRLGGDPAST